MFLLANKNARRWLGRAARRNQASERKRHGRNVT
jgi:hypothetical protein